MPSKPLITRVPNHFVKTLTFDGGSGSGATGTVAVATVTGRVLVPHLSIYCTTSLTSSGAIQLGTAVDADSLIASTDLSSVDLLANEVWNDATPGPQLGADSAIVDQIVGSNIIITVSTAAVTAGVLEVSLFWLPLSVNGNLA